jgi:hypothetical protein
MKMLVSYGFLRGFRYHIAPISPSYLLYRAKNTNAGIVGRLPKNKIVVFDAAALQHDE